jgi:hypothetical protein
MNARLWCLDARASKVGIGGVARVAHGVVGTVAVEELALATLHTTEVAR